MALSNILAAPLFALAASCLLQLTVPPLAHGQGTAADYERSANLHELTRNKVFRDRVRPHWNEPGDAFWYRVQAAPDAYEYIYVKAATGERDKAFDHVALADALSEASGEEISPSSLSLDELSVDDDAAAFAFADQRWKWSKVDKSLTPLKSVEKKQNDEQHEEKDDEREPNEEKPGTPSPDSRYVVFVRDANVFLRDEETSGEIALTTDGTAADGYLRRIHWSPDSKKFVVMREVAAEEHTVYLIESSPTDRLQPKLHEFEYLKPGDRIAQRKPHLFHVGARRRIIPDDALFLNPWSIRDVRWDADGDRFTFVYNQRGHQVLRIVAVDAETGEAGALVDETSETFIDYAYKQFTHFADDTDEIIWMSERDGWNHLYLCDAQTGDVKNQITRGSWVVRGVERVDEKTRQIWFRAAGVYPEQDPYYIHYGRVNFDGSSLTWLTRGNGTHEVEFSPDDRFLIDRYSRVDMPPVAELRSTDDGALICELEQADWSDLRATGWQPPERFQAKGRDGETDIYGVIWKPTNFDETKQFPVIEHIYAGPHGSFTPKGFRSFYRTQEIAELGFIVVQCDGMGTSHRSKAFHDVASKNLGDSGFPDRIAWMRAAAKMRPYMDLNRVGIYGGSAGGQSTLRALLAHGDFYHVGVADCGCHDNRMDKIWWNELWMGWPLGPHYEEQSNVTNAGALTGKLLLIVGELDRNVDPASTMQVVDALVKADKDFDLLVLPGVGHGAAETPYGSRRRKDFLVRHLLGVEPRSQ